IPIIPYSKQLIGLYGELGIVDRWLTLSADATLFRFNRLEDQGSTRGLGDLRIGAWTGLIESPLRLSAGFLVGIPTGDASPRPGASSADPEAQLIARSLPTGDGEWD